VNRPALIRVAGGIVMALGVWSAVWGLRHLTGEPMRGSRLPYASSRQLQAVCGGIGIIVLGAFVYAQARRY
jgi:hypothetical protein